MTQPPPSFDPFDPSSGSAPADLVDRDDADSSLRPRSSVRVITPEGGSDRVYVVLFLPPVRDDTRERPPWTSPLWRLRATLPASGHLVLAVSRRDQALLQMHEDSCSPLLYRALRMGRDECAITLLEGAHWRHVQGLDGLGLSGRGPIGEAFEAWDLASHGGTEVDRHACRRGFRRLRSVLLQHLDAGAVAVLRRSGAGASACLYNFLMQAGGNRAWREQAIVAYPGLLAVGCADDMETPFEGGPWSPPGSHGLMLREYVSGVVDDGGSLTSALALFYGVPAWCVRRLQGVPRRALRGWIPSDVPRVLRLLALAGQRSAPVGAAQWEALPEMARTFESLLGAVATLHEDAIPFMENGPVRNTLLAALKKGLPAASRRLDDVLEGHGEVGDLLDSLRRAVPFGPDAMCAVALAVATLPLRDLVEWSNRWHRRLAALSAEAVASGWDPQSLRHWTCPLEPFDVQGYRVVPLDSEAALIAEGAAMRHCVAGYAEACLSGYTYIFSIRDGHGRRFSTLQVDVDWTGKPPTTRVVQHRGFRNAMPGHAVLELEPVVSERLREKLVGLAPPHWQGNGRDRGPRRGRGEQEAHQARSLARQALDETMPESLRTALGLKPRRPPAESQQGPSPARIAA